MHETTFQLFLKVTLLKFLYVPLTQNIGPLFLIQQYHPRKMHTCFLKMNHNGKSWHIQLFPSLLKSYIIIENREPIPNNKNILYIKNMSTCVKNWITNTSKLSLKFCKGTKVSRNVIKNKQFIKHSQMLSFNSSTPLTISNNVSINIFEILIINILLRTSIIFCLSYYRLCFAFFPMPHRFTFLYTILGVLLSAHFVSPLSKLQQIRAFYSYSYFIHCKKPFHWTRLIREWSAFFQSTCYYSGLLQRVYTAFG